MSEAKGETAPALGVSINAQFAAGRQIVFQTHVDQEIAPKKLQELLIKFNNAIDKEEAFYEINDEMKRLEVDRNVLTNITRRLDEVETNMQAVAVASGKREHKPTQKDLNDKKQAQDSLAEAKKRVKDGEARIAALKEKAGNRDVPSSAADR